MDLMDYTVQQRHELRTLEIGGRCKTAEYFASFLIFPRILRVSPRCTRESGCRKKEAHPIREGA